MAKALAVLVALISISVVVQMNIVKAITYKVGDDKGWTFGVESWTNGKIFKAGDVLEFNYNPELHNMVVVKEANYNRCDATGGNRFDTGNDTFTLGAGTTYFICGFPNHCEAKQKIAVTPIA